MIYKVGTDPEMFLKLGHKFIPACGLFPGTKDEPFEVEKGAVQVDGLALEFNIHPAESSEEFDKNIKTVLAQVDEMIKKVDKDLWRVFVPVADFDPIDFAKLTEDQKRLGCDPDYNGITGLINPRPEIQDEPFRTAAGHIHIGWTKDADVTDPAHFEDCRFVSQYIGNKGYFYPYGHDQLRRLKYYGGNYSFRPKSYGVEIRFPSNNWVNDQYTRVNAFDNIQRVMKELEAA